MKLYGIPNCNSVKKARSWLSGRNLAYDFHDFKKSDVSESMLRNWCKQVGWETLVNRKGTTWRQLPDEMKNRVYDEDAAIELMLEKSSVIKRPVLEKAGEIQVGFSEASYETLFPNA